MARASASSISEITKKEEENNKNSKLKDNVGEAYSLMENHSLRIPALVKPLDGGWGWFVVLASFLIHVISKFIKLFSLIVFSFLSLSFQIWIIRFPRKMRSRRPRPHFSLFHNVFFHVSLIKALILLSFQYLLHSGSV